MQHANYPEPIRDSRTRNLLIAALLVLCVPAFLIHLGLFAFTGDEAIRALVALEMKLSGQYIATTMHGADYINKPPLFNWFVLGMSELWGGFGEWPSRMTTLVFLGCFAGLHYRFLRRHFDRDTAFIGALMLVTSGRLLFYDAMLGLIDTTFSCVMYALFMSIYFFGKKEKWLQLFVASYLLMALGFLLKGFPALVFQGLSLLTGLIFFKQFRRLFSWQHVAGFMTGAAVIGLYLAVLSQYRSLDLFLGNLFQESAKRTVVAYDWYRFWKHLLEFPFDSVYHFLPWSLLLLFWLDRRLLEKLRSQPFVFYNFLILAVNLPVYWTSVEVQPRYLLMFIPLFNTVGIYLLHVNAASNHLRFRIYFPMQGALLALGAALCLALPFLPAVNYLNGIGVISAVLALALGSLAILYFRKRDYYLWWFIAGLLVVRIGFNLVVLPVRNDESIVTRARADVRALADQYRDRTWWVYGDAYIREPASFYLTERLGYIVRRTTDTSHPNSIYLVNPDVYPDFPGRCVDTLQTDYPEIRHLLYVTD